MPEVAWQQTLQWHDGSHEMRPDVNANDVFFAFAAALGDFFALPLKPKLNLGTHVS